MQKSRNKSEKLLEPKQLVGNGKVIVIMHMFRRTILGSFTLRCLNKGHLSETQACA